MEISTARRVIRAGLFLWTRVLEWPDGLLGLESGPTPSRRNGGECCIGADCTGGGASGAPGDVTWRCLQTPYVISRITRPSRDGSLTETVTSSRVISNYTPVL